MSGRRDKKLRKEMREEARLILAQDPRAALAFTVSNVREEMVPQPPPTQVAVEPPLSPEERELTRLYKTFATTVWRMRNVIFDTETNAPKEELNERGVAKLARYLETLDGALEDAHVQVKGDYAGNPCDEGDAVDPISYEDRQDLTRDEYVETLTPTVRWIDKDGKPRLLQRAEVVVGRAKQN